MNHIANLLKSVLANHGAPENQLRLNPHLTKEDVAQTVALAIAAIESDTATALIREIAALERDHNDEFGDVIIDGTTDLFDRIQAHANFGKRGQE